MKSTLMNWTEDQWKQAYYEYQRVTGHPGGLRSMFSAMRGDKDSLMQHADLQAWWMTKYTMDPPDIPVVKPVERKQMSTGQRIDFGFECKIVTMGWRECFNRQAHVYEVRVRVGDACFGAQHTLPYHKTMMYRDEHFKRAIERECHENIKREVFDKLFPNL